VDKQQADFDFGVVAAGMQEVGYQIVCLYLRFLANPVRYLSGVGLHKRAHSK
jgi:hypothetical protein